MTNWTTFKIYFWRVHTGGQNKTFIPVGSWIKTPTVPKRAVTSHLTGPVAGAALDSEGHAMSQLSLPHPIMKIALFLILT